MGTAAAAVGTVAVVGMEAAVGTGVVAGMDVAAGDAGTADIGGEAVGMVGGPDTAGVVIPTTLTIPIILGVISPGGPFFIVLVLERLKRWPEVEAGPDFKISGRTRCRQRNAFRIEHEKILASPYRVPLKITNRR